MREEVAYKNALTHLKKTKDLLVKNKDGQKIGKDCDSYNKFLDEFLDLSVKYFILKIFFLEKNLQHPLLSISPPSSHH